MKLNIRLFLKSIFICILLIFCGACSTIHLIDRTDKDILIDQKDSDILRGTYHNKGIEKNWSVYEMIYDRKILKKKYPNDSLLVQLNPVDPNTIELSFSLKNEIVKTTKLKGSYENGFF